MKRAFTLMEVMVVLAVTTILATVALSMVNARAKTARAREDLDKYLAILRAERQAFVNDGSFAMVVGPQGGRAQLRWVTGTCAEDIGGDPRSQLVNVRTINVPVLTTWCVDRFGRATSVAMAPQDVTLSFTGITETATWDRNGRIFVPGLPFDDPPVRPRIENVTSLNTRDPTPGTVPTNPPDIMQPGVLR